MHVGLAVAQTQTVTGTVTSGEDGMPVVGASVFAKDAAVGTITDIDGHFILRDVPVSVKVLRVSYIGMQTLEMAIAPTMKVILYASSETLDEVVVVAYGTTKKSGLTGATVNISAKTIEARPITSVTSVLEGNTGIMTTTGSGQPGESPTVRIRGVGSVNASNNPLVVLDGFPYAGDLVDINPYDIESITVLKDASSAALYGSRAANGVIMVTSKKGKEGGLKVNFKTTHGFSSRGTSEYEKVGIFEYVPLMYEAMRNGFIVGGTTPENASANARAQVMNKLGVNPFNVPDGEVITADGKMNPNASLLYNDFDWEGAISRTGYRGEYSLNASGGTDKATYMMSVGYLKENGHIICSDMERMNAKAIIDVSPVRWFKAGVNIAGAISQSNNVLANSENSGLFANPVNFTRYIAPIYPVYKHEADGSFVLDKQGNKVFEWDDRAFSKGRHIVAELEWNSIKYERNVLGTRAYGEFTLMEGLRVTLNTGFDKRNNYHMKYDNPHVGDGSPAGRGRKRYYSGQTWNFNQLLNYDKSFDLHNIQLLAGHESYEYQYDFFDAQKSGIISEGNSELINFSSTATLNSYQHTMNHEGYLFRASYDYDSKYYASVSYRRDGSSRFHKDVRWGNFWSVGTGWRIDRERFMADIGWIDMLKLRMAYGETGNDGILNNSGDNLYYPWMDLYNIQRNGTVAGFIQSTTAGNNKLKWEKNSSLDVAVEFSLFNRRLHGLVEFYRRNSDNLLFNVFMPVSSGMDIQPQNIGSMYNQGIELDVTGDIFRTRDFTWSMNFNLTTLKNRITKMPNGEEIISDNKKLAEGHGLYNFWLRTYVGVNPDNGSAMYLLDETIDYGTNFYEYNGMKVTENQNYAKYEWHGKAMPDMYGGIRNMFSYKDVSLSVLLTYSLGGKVYDNSYVRLMSSGTYGNAVHKDILKRWQNPGDVTDVPKMDASKAVTFDPQLSRWLVNASSLTLKNVTLSYNLPQNIAQRISLGSIQTYVSGENLHMFTKRKGLNPSQSFDGVQRNMYQPTKVITFGLSLSF